MYLKKVVIENRSLPPKYPEQLTLLFFKSAHGMSFSTKIITQKLLVVMSETCSVVM